MFLKLMIQEVVGIQMKTLVTIKFAMTINSLFVYAGC